MTESLAYGNFRWLSQEEINKLDVNNIPNKDNKGYILEVDLEYPQELHDLHSDYPLAPENIIVNNAMLCPYSKVIKNKLNISDFKVPN